ncbi:MAG: TlpA family protein disulfide reductase [Gemmatimonadetes bacterium]|nr:TlpA family protein disulfide reductase [Gemmatimonadota bacterium]
MNNRRQWTAVIGTVMAIGFGVAFVIKIRPQMNLLAVGSRAPDFPAMNLTGNRSVAFSEYRGKVILLNVWATWCQPCRIEMPSIERLHRKFVGTDFRVVAVSVDKDGPEVVEAFVKGLGLTFEVWHDRSGDIQRIYQTTGVPESFVIDRDGVIVKKLIGAAEWDGPVNETLIRRLLDAR